MDSDRKDVGRRGWRLSGRGEKRQRPHDPPAEPDTVDPAPGQAGEAPDAGRGLVDPSRRSLLAKLTLSISGVIAAAFAIPWLAFLFSPVLRADPRVWRPVGRVEDFPVGATVLVTYLDAHPLPWAGFAAESAAWVRRESDDGFAAFTIYCTHVGCPIRWESGANLFMCPCHGGAFHADGSVAAGPPPRPLDRYPVRVRNGQVELQTVGVPAPRRVL